MRAEGLKTSRVGDFVLMMAEIRQLTRKWLNGYFALHELGRRPVEMV